MKDIGDLTLRELAERVEGINHANETVEYLELAQYVKKVTNQIVGIVQKQSDLHFHPFQSYANPDINPGCVRCPYPENHPVHKKRAASESAGKQDIQVRGKPLAAEPRREVQESSWPLIQGSGRLSWKDRGQEGPSEGRDGD